MAFNPDDYKKLFDQRFGAGSFNAGMQQARDIGTTKIQADVAKQNYQTRLKEYKAQQKAAEKASKKKTYMDATNYWSDPTNKSSLQKQGVYKAAEEIKNNPELQNQITSQGYNISDYIDAMYNAATDGKFRSEREYNQYSKDMAKQGKEKQKKLDKKYKDQYGMNYKEYQDLQKKTQKPTENKEKNKKKDTGIVSKIESGIMKGLDIINRPDNAVLTGIKEKLNGGSFIKGAKEGLLGKKTTTGTEVDKKLGLDPSKNKVVGLAENLLGKSVIDKLPLGKLISPFVNNKTKTKVGQELHGMSTAATVDPLNLLGIGSAADVLNGVKILNKGADAAKGAEEAAQGIEKLKNLSKADELLNVLADTKTSLPKPFESKFPNLKLPVKSLDNFKTGDVPKVEIPNVLKMDFPKFNPKPNARLGLPEANVGQYTKEAISQQADNLLNQVNALDNAPKGGFNQRLLNVQKDMKDFADRRGIYRKELTPDELYQSVKQPNDPATFDELIKSAELENNAQTAPKNLTSLLRNDPKVAEGIQKLNALGGLPKKSVPPMPDQPNTQSIDEMLNFLKDVKKEPTVKLPSGNTVKAPDIGTKLPENPFAKLQEFINSTKNKDVSNSSLFLSPKSLSEENLLKTVTTNKTLDTMSKDELQTVYNQLESKKSTLSTTKASQKQADAIEADMKKVNDFLLKMDLQKFGKEKVSPAILDEVKQSSGNADTFRAKISETPTKTKNDMIGNLRTQLVDDAYPAYKYEKQITGNINSAENSLYKTMRTFKGSPEKAHAIVKDQLEPIFHEMEQKGINIKDLRDYSLAVHARDVNAQGINSGMTNAEIADVIKKFGSPEMESLRQKLVGVNDFTMKLLSSGEHPVLDPQLVVDLKKKWPNYMSLFRSMDDSKVEFSKGISNSLVNATSPLKKLEGLSAESTLKTIDPMESLVKNIFKAVNTSDRNSVSAQVAKLAENDATGQIIRKLAPGEDSSRLNVIHLMDKGKKVYYEVPPDLYKSLKNLDAETTNTLVKLFQKPAGMLRAGATLTPEFSLRNPMRDVAQAYVTSESGFNPFTDFAVGLWQSIWKGRTIKIGEKEFQTSGELYKQFIHENGGYGNIVSMDRNLHQKLLKEVLNDHNLSFVDIFDTKTYSSLLKKYGNPIKALRKISDVSETATKVGEFRAALRSGATPQEAAYRARDLMDFARAGSSVRNVNKVVAFLNANIQGKSKLIRALQANPAGFMGKALTAVTLPTIGAIVAQNKFANEKQKQIIDDAPKWLKDSFYLIPIPGTDQIARIPKPFDLSYPFSNVVERAFDFVQKHDKHAFDGFIKSSFSSASIPVMLTGLLPFVEGMANYSWFREGPIIPARESNINYPDQYDINTSETAKFLAKGINKLTGGTGNFKNFGSPRVIDNTIQGLTGGTGAYVSNAVDWFLNSTGMVNNPDKPSKTIDQKPLTRAFLVNQSSSGESLDKLYAMKDKLARAKGSAKEHNQPFMQMGQYNIANSATKSIGKISSQMRTIQNSTQFTSDQKKQLLDQLIQQRNMIAIQSMKRLNQMDQ